MAAELSIEIAGLSKRFDEVAAVDAVTLAIRRGEFFSLLGPSGCGKTTLLRLIAGLEPPSAGTLRIAGADMSGVPAHRRPVNLVFQHYALFPHLTVADNVAFGLRYQSVPRQAQAARVAAALALVRLQNLDRRYPHQLSGGQRQRVALARAIALAPQVLLLDEPLGALDLKLRQEMQLELKRLQRTLGITFVFVTHDQEEALAMSDTIAVMNRGRVEQVGSPEAVFERPETAFVADFMGAANTWSAEVSAVAGGRLDLALDNGLTLSVPCRGAGWHPGDAVRLVVRPEKLALRPTAAAGTLAAALPVTVEDRAYQGASTVWTVRDAAGARFVVHQPSGAPFAAGLPGAAAPGPDAAASAPASPLSLSLPSPPSSPSPPSPPSTERRPGEASDLAPGQSAFLSWDPRHTVLLREPC